MKNKYKGLTPEESYKKILEAAAKLIEKKATKVNEKNNLTPEEKLNRKYLKKFNKPLHIQAFSIETIRKAYEVTGLTPSQGIYYINSFGTIVNRAYLDDTRELACPMGALCISRNKDYLHLDGDSWKEAAVAQILDVPSAFVSGFIQGFDNCQEPNARCSPWLIQGYDNGKNILNLMAMAGEVEIQENQAPPTSFPTKDAEKDLIKSLQQELNFDKKPVENDEEEIIEDYEAEPEEEPPPIFIKKALPKAEILINLDKPLKEAVLEMLNNFQDTNLLYLIPTRYSNQRLTVNRLKEEVSENTTLGQQYVLDLLYIAKDTLAKETERLPFKFGNQPKDLPPRIVEAPAIETFLHEEEDE